MGGEAYGPEGEVRAIGRGMPAQVGCAHRHRRVVVGPRASDDRPGLTEVRLGDLERLVGDPDPRFKGVQLGIVEDLPPVSPERLVRRLRFLPSRARPLRPLLLVGRGHRNRRLRVLRADGAAAEQQKGQRRRLQDGGPQGPHWPPPVAPGGTTLTACPETSESGGLRTICSVPAGPARTSTALPRSRPRVTATSSTFPSRTTARRRPSERKSSAFPGTSKGSALERNRRWTWA